MPTDNQQANQLLQELHESCDNDGKFIIRTASPGMRPDFDKPFVYQGNIEVADDKQYYYTINPRNDFNGYSQGGNQDVKCLIGLYADIDCGEEGHKKGSFHETKEQALKAVEEFPLKPTWIVDSGHGLQVLFLFNEALVPGEDITLGEYEALNRGLQIALGADTTADASRLLRLPGSLNLKGEPKEVKTLDHDPDNRYEVDDFLEYISPVESHAATVQLDRELNRVEYDKRRLPRRAREIISNLSDPKYPGKDDRSSLVHTAVCLLHVRDFTPDQIFSALTEEGTSTRDYLIGKRKNEDAIKKYLNRSISKAEVDILREEKVQAKRREDAIGTFEILGTDVNSTLYFWKSGAIYPVKLKNFTRDQFQLLSGIRFSPEEFEKVKSEIIYQAFEKDHIDMNDKMLEGAWKIREDFLLITKDKVLLASPGGGAEELKVPVYDHKIIEFSKASDWLDTEHFLQSFGNASLKAVYDKVHTLTQQFSWKHAEAADYAAALVMLTVVQQAMSWRPWIYLLGASNSGKTTFLQSFFDRLFPGLLAHMGKTTAHSIAQQVGNSGRIVILDEFERSSKLQQIIELAKLSNRGGKKTSGTPGPNSLEYAIHQMFWFGSILSSLGKESEENRTIFLELTRHDGKNPPAFPKPQEMKQVGAEIVAVMIQNWNRIQERSQEVHGRYPELDSRMNESLAYPMALLELVEEEEDNPTFFKTPPEFVYRQVEKEEDAILDDIMNSLIWIHSYSTSLGDRREQARVFDAIKLEKHPDLHNAGMALTETGGRKYLAMHCKSVQRQVLKDMRDYGFVNIAEPLKRLPGAIPNHAVKIGGKSLRCILIPLEYITTDEEEAGEAPAAVAAG